MLRKEARNPDVTWTGSRFGIVYEDISTILPAVRLMTVDEVGELLLDVEISPNATEPQIAWGRDRFGLVWRAGSCQHDCVNFARFDRHGKPLDKPEELEFSGSRAAIAFTGSSVAKEASDSGRSESQDGAFGIAYEGFYAFRATADVRLAIRPREASVAEDVYPIIAGKPGETILVNERNHQCSCWGTMPSIAANVTGFTLCWHEFKDGKQHGAGARYVSLDGAMPIPELTPDPDAGRASRLAWTGSEYVAVNDNVMDGASDLFEVHLRRLDPSGNSHLVAGWGPWREVRFSDLAPGKSSSNPDIVTTGATLGVIWLEMDDRDATAGRIWFANIAHQ